MSARIPTTHDIHDSKMSLSGGLEVLTSIHRLSSSSASDRDRPALHSLSTDNIEHSGRSRRDRSKSKSPAMPKTTIFTGSDTQIGRLSSTNSKEQLLDDSGPITKKYVGCWTVQEMLLVAHHDYNTLKKYLKRRFSTKEASI
jgi:hypothetical protein